MNSSFLGLSICSVFTFRSLRTIQEDHQLSSSSKKTIDMRLTSSSSRYVNEKHLSFPKDSHQRVRSNKKKWIFFIILLALIYPIIIIVKNQTYSTTIIVNLSSLPQENLLDGCQYVYIDMGTNIGIQIRKLYEPQLYPNSSVFPLFTRIFGKHTKEVCSVGFEANPVHEIYLKQFEKYCLKLNYRVKIFTSTAVSITDVNQDFYTQPKDTLYNQWGSSLQPNSNKTKITVASIDIASWFKRIVLTRKLPSGMNSSSSRIMMKTDIEEHDSIVLTNLIFTGVFCSIDLIYGEHFDHEFQNAVAVLKKYTNSCKTELIFMDDETHHNIRVPFVILK